MKPSTFGLRGKGPYPISDEDMPDGIAGGSVVTGADAFGLGMQVLIAEWGRLGAPRLGVVRELRKRRIGKKAFPLVIGLIDRDSSVWILGPSSDSQLVGPISQIHSERLLQAVLDEPSGVAAHRRITNSLRALSESADTVGVTNRGLFATHYLTSVLPEDSVWSAANERAREWLTLRESSLIKALGFSARGVGANALVLLGTGANPSGVAVLLKASEAFDSASTRFAVSPVSYGLSVAQREEVPWLMVLRGSQIRLYAARPGVGVGSRGQAETYFEVDLALVSETHAAYLDLAFSASALGENGSINGLLEGSNRHATGLGERLRQRIYEDAIPRLAVAVADELNRVSYQTGGDLSSAYRVTLRILFRLLFQAYAEDRGLLPYGRNDLYTRYSLKRQALDMVEKPEASFDENSYAIWLGLQQVWSVIDTGDSQWDVPAYNGGLFSTDLDFYPEGEVLTRIRVNNAVIGHTLRCLIVDETVDGVVGAVDFRALSVREFGTIYEGLLESSLARADQDLTLDKDDKYLPAKGPEEVVVASGEAYFYNRSGQRKATGSYFTPHFVVEHLLDQALTPVLEGHLDRIAQLLDDGDQAAAAEQFFDFRVADISMGSGHFLTAAIDRIEAAMSTFLVDHELPGITAELLRLETTARKNLGDTAGDFEIEPSALLRRQIARRCIYGVDINDVAIELARVAVWIHTFVPGLPMSTLDRNLVEADSLTGIGTVNEAITILDPSSKKGQGSVFSFPISNALEEAKKLLMAAANASEATKAEVREAAAIHRRAQEAARPTKLLFDAAVAARLGIIDIEDRDVDSIRQEAERPEVAEELALLKSGHMPYLFPEVFLRPNPGFDVIIGNPPWDKATIEENGFWALRFPGLKSMTTAKQNAAIVQLRSDRPDLYTEFQIRHKTIEHLRKVLLKGPFPGMGAGHPDLYQAFVWRFWHLVRNRGRIGVVLPRSVFTDAGSAPWRRSVLTKGAFTDVIMLYNRKHWVFDIHASYYIALVAIDKHSPSKVLPYRGPFGTQAAFDKAIHEESVQFPADDYLTWTQQASLPMLPTPQSVDVFLQMQTHPRMDLPGEWYARPYQELNATTDKKSRGGIVDVDSPGRDDEWPVYKGESFDLWEPDTGVQYGWANSESAVKRLQSKRLNGYKSRREPHRLFDKEVIDDEGTLSVWRARIAIRDTTYTTNARTVLAALIPPKVPAVHLAPVMMWPWGDERDESYLLGVLCSIPFDWCARKLVKGHLSFFLFRALPVPRPGRAAPLRRQVEVLAGRLAAVDDRYARWADAVGVEIQSVRSEAEKDDLMARLDAAVAHLYGLKGWQVEHIFETFHDGWDYGPRLDVVMGHYADMQQGMGL